MPKIQYIEKRFAASSMRLIEQANQIIAEYAQEGLELTLRQLYYQFVSRDLIANKQSEYKRLGSIISDARLAGLVDWMAIEDRTRNLKVNYHNSSPGDAVQEALRHFMLNRWLNQPYRPEVWIEKEALVGVIMRVCRSLDVPYFACRGYTSQSEMWRAAQRLASYRNRGQCPVIIYLGDHDPSGIDMTRDIIDRNSLFQGDGICKVRRIALNFDQVERYSPPPNPAKLSDSRARGYIDQYGELSWELDALEPRVIVDLIESTVAEFMDVEAMNKTLDQEIEYKGVLQRVVDNWRSL